MRKKNIQRLVIAAVLLIVLPFVISQFMLECLTKLFAMDPDQASTIASTGQVIVQALAAVMIIVQLGQDNREAKQQSEIEAARFLFQYNQSFLEDENVIEIERLIDKEYMDEIDGIPRTNSVINNTNRQYVVNYLVYLEGLAPLVLNGTLKLEVIDDLMSYRFFLAVNNPEIQKKHLFVFPDDYRGCFKLYKAWKAYRIAHGREILQAQYSLDHWHDFNLYANDTNSGKIEIEKGASVKSYEEVAAIMFCADPYIFPVSNGSNDILFIYRIYSGDSTSFQLEKDALSPEKYESGGTTYYIMSNMDDYFVSWLSGNIECTISGISTHDEALKMITSLNQS